MRFFATGFCLTFLLAAAVAARSYEDCRITVTLKNQTRGAIITNSKRLLHGKWGAEPPDRIEPGRSGSFTATGTKTETVEGWIQYRIEGYKGGMFGVDWNIPAWIRGWSTNGFGVWKDPAYADEPDCLFRDGSCKHCKATITITVPDNWR